MTAIKNADLIRAVLDGRSIRYTCDDGSGDTAAGEYAIYLLATDPRRTRKFELAPEPKPPVQNWLVVGVGAVYSFINRHVEKETREYAKMHGYSILRIDIDPDTLQVVNTPQTEEP